MDENEKHSRLFSGELYGKTISERELECLKYIANGLRIKRVANKLGITEDTVNYHLRSLRNKLNAKTLPEAVAKAVKFGFLEP